eukprot:5666637-Pleurochrysis_carterae.AAC.1
MEDRLHEKKKHFKEEKRASKQLDAWPPFPDRRRFVMKWLRAQLLYGLMPADKPFFYVMQQRVPLIFYALVLCPFGIAVVPWLLLLIAIDKTDEARAIACMHTMHAHECEDARAGIAFACYAHVFTQTYPHARACTRAHTHNCACTIGCARTNACTFAWALIPCARGT